MPDWSNRYYDIGTATSPNFYATIPPIPQVQQDYTEYIQECERQDHIIQQQIEKEKQLQEDKENYPLFFLKGGIV